MAAIYGSIQGNTNQRATRCGHQYIKSMVKTWEGQIDVHLDRDGNAVIDIAGDIKATIHAADTQILNCKNLTPKEIEHKEKEERLKIAIGKEKSNKYTPGQGW